MMRIVVNLDWLPAERDPEFIIGASEEQISVISSMGRSILQIQQVLVVEFAAYTVQWLQTATVGSKFRYLASDADPEFILGFEPIDLNSYVLTSPHLKTIVNESIPLNDLTEVLWMTVNNVQQMLNAKLGYSLPLTQHGT